MNLWFGLGRRKRWKKCGFLFVGLRLLTFIRLGLIPSAGLGRAGRVGLGLVLCHGSGLRLVLAPFLILLTLKYGLQLILSSASLIGCGAARRDFQVLVKIFFQSSVVAQLDVDICKEQENRGIIRLQVPSLRCVFLSFFGPLQRRKRAC